MQPAGLDVWNTGEGKVEEGNLPAHRSRTRTSHENNSYFLGVKSSGILVFLFLDLHFTGDYSLLGVLCFLASERHSILIPIYLFL